MTPTRRPWLVGATCCALAACGADPGVQSTPGDGTGTTSSAPNGGAPEPSGEATGESGENAESADDTGQPPPVDPSYGDEARAALSDALDFYRTLNHHGGWVWTYAEDLSRSWGEGEATADQLWVQPPGTPAIGMVYLRAYWATGDEAYLEAASEAAAALRYGQLESGGGPTRSTSIRKVIGRRSTATECPPEKTTPRWTTTSPRLRFAS